MPNNGKYWFAKIMISTDIIMIFAIRGLRTSDNAIAKKKANIINIRLLFINGLWMKNMTPANSVNRKATPILLRMLLPLSEFLLLAFLNNDIKNKTVVTIKIILLNDVSSNEKVIFLKKCEYESIKTLTSPNKNTIPNTMPYIMR